MTSRIQIKCRSDKAKRIQYATMINLSDTLRFVRPTQNYTGLGLNLIFGHHFMMLLLDLIRSKRKISIRVWFQKLSHRGLTELNAPLVGGGDEGSTSFRDEEILNDAVRTLTASYERTT